MRPQVFKTSVVIPAKNEEENIDDLLRSLLEQSVRADEIIIVDAGSTDATISIINKYKPKLPINLICKKNLLPGKARNVGIQSARNEIIALTDAGIILDNEWLERISNPFRNDPDLDVVYGSYACYSKTLFEECFSIVYFSPTMKNLGKRVRSPSVASLAIKKKVWSFVGFFPEHLRATEDLLFLDAIENSTFKAKIVPEAIVYWRPRQNIQNVFKYSLSYSKCNAKTNYNRLRIFKKCLMYFTGIVLLIWGVITKSPEVILFLCFGMVVNAGMVCRKNSDILFKIGISPKSILNIFLIIFVLDIGNILGFCIGLFSEDVNNFTIIKKK